MRVLLFVLLVLTSVEFPLVQGQAIDRRVEVGESDWPWWRGPNGDGIASPDQSPPTKWSETDNLRWRVAVPGRGHGSPTVLGERVFLATADHDLERQLVLCFDRNTGKTLWQAVVHEGGFKNKSPRTANERASLASATIATDGNRLFVNFLNDSAVWVSALSLDGTILWQQNIGEYLVHQGYGSSPAIYQHLVIVSSDSHAGGAIAGLNRETGNIEWLRRRPEMPNYTSPAILKVNGRDQLVLSGCELVTSLDPLTGEELWEIDGATTECVTTAVTDGTHVFTSGGYPKNHIAAVVADGSGKVAWENGTRAYVPSMLQVNGFLFVTLDAGVASCFRCDDGQEVWKARLGGTFSSSPVLVNDTIYATNEEGTTFLFKADPEKYVPISENQLGLSVYATPAICGGQIFMRVAQMEQDRRQEYLVCIAE